MGDWTPPDKRFSELPLRLASALVLIPFALGAVWMGGMWLAAACAVFAVVMIMEWCSMSAAAHPRSLAFLAGLCGLLLASGYQALPAAAFAAALAFALVSSRSGVKARLTAGFGVLYVSAMVAGLFWLREGPWDGRAAALLFMSFVWASDAAAYFFGRALRGPRLLPSESPNKTWSGAVAAVIACGICGYFAAGIQDVDAELWIVTGVAISVVAQAGDLFESGLKRRFNVKDSGKILPGHGGLLDRVDGLGAVSVAGFLALAVIPGYAPVLGF